MKTLKTTVILAALLLSGCAAPSLPTTTTAGGSVPDPSNRKLALNAQARELRTKIIDRRQKIMVFEVMLTDVERRAAMSQVALSYLPNTNLLSEAAPERAGSDRLSVTVKASSVAAPAAKPAVKKRPAKKKRMPRKSSSPG